jgi:hypothetical protein
LRLERSGMRIRFSSLFAGVVIDLLTRVLVGLLFGAVVVAQGVDLADVQARISSDSALLTATLLVRFLSAFLGGFVAGRGGPGGVPHGVVVGVFSVLLGLVVAGGYPGWFTVTAIVLTVPCAAVGGWVGSGVATPRGVAPAHRFLRAYH